MRGVSPVPEPAPKMRASPVLGTLPHLLIARGNPLVPAPWHFVISFHQGSVSLRSLPQLAHPAGKRFPLLLSPHLRLPVGAPTCTPASDGEEGVFHSALLLIPSQ